MKRIFGGRDHTGAMVPTYASKMEIESCRMLGSVKKTEEELSAYYLRMLQGNTPQEEILQKEASLYTARSILCMAPALYC